VLSSVSNQLRQLVRILLIVVFALGMPTIARAQDNSTIAAASDLKFALDEIITNFKKESGKTVIPTYGSSGNFKTQIIQGAPFQMFMSADEGFVFELADKSLTLDRGVLYAVGRVVLFAPTGATWKPDPEFSDFKAALSDGRITQFAIANPEHAPYGRAAEQSLRTLKIWDSVSPKLVLGENVSQAAQFATSGSTQGGIFALSLALSPKVGKLGTYALIPAESHKPLRQQMVLLKNADETTKAFYEYIQSPPVRSLLQQYGFVLPGEEG
jgi:molybdate transport system substrate-binding protein